MWNSKIEFAIDVRYRYPSLRGFDPYINPAPTRKHIMLRKCEQVNGSQSDTRTKDTPSLDVTAEQKCSPTRAH